MPGKLVSWALLISQKRFPNAVSSKQRSPHHVLGHKHQRNAKMKKKSQKREILTTIIAYVVSLEIRLDMSLVMRIPTFWFSTRSETNRAVQSQKMARCLKFQIRKKRGCTIYVAKTKALISFAATERLICVFVFTCAKRWFSHDAAQL